VSSDMAHRPNFNRSPLVVLHVAWVYPVSFSFNFCEFDVLRLAGLRRHYLIKINTFI